MATRDQIQNAITAGEVMTVVYHGGSQPGAVRDIAPISISGNKVRVRCYTSKALKTFVIEKIELVGDKTAETASEWTPNADIAPHFESIDSLVAEEESSLLALGWHIEHDPESLCLHRRFKNGRPLKGSDVSLQYEEMTYDLVLGDDGDFHKENFRQRKRPWTVRGKKQTTRTFKNLDKAAELFLNWGKLMAPASKEVIR